MNISEWFAILIIGWFVVITPGPNMVVVIRNSLLHSRGAGFCTAIGLALGNLVHITYCLIGIGVLISKSILLFNIVKWLGAGYLIYLGIKSLRSKPKDKADLNPDDQSFSNFDAFRTGLLTDLLNPKATLFFLALFTQIIRPSTPMTIQILYGITIVGLELSYFAVLSTIMGHRSVRYWFKGISHWLERITGFVLIGMGLRVAFSRR